MAEVEGAFLLFGGGFGVCVFGGAGLAGFFFGEEGVAFGFFAGGEGFLFGFGFSVGGVGRCELRLCMVGVVGVDCCWGVSLLLCVAFGAFGPVLGFSVGGLGVGHCLLLGCCLGFLLRWHGLALGHCNFDALVA